MRDTVEIMMSIRLGASIPSHMMDMWEEEDGRYVAPPDTESELAAIVRYVIENEDDSELANKVDIWFRGR